MWIFLFSERLFLGLNEKNENKNENEIFSYISPNERVVLSNEALSN